MGPVVDFLRIGGAWMLVRRTEGGCSVASGFEKNWDKIFRQATLWATSHQGQIGDKVAFEKPVLVVSSAGDIYTCFPEVKIFTIHCGNVVEANRIAAEVAQQKGYSCIPSEE